MLLLRAAEGEKADQYRGEAILDLLHELYMVIYNSIAAEHSLLNSQAGLDTLLAVAGLYESIFADGNSGIFHNDICAIYLRCAGIAIHLKDCEHAMQYTDTALEHFVALKQVQEKTPFTAPLIDKAKNYRPGIVLFNRAFFEEHLQAFPAEYADTVRNNPEYASVFTP